VVGYAGFEVLGLTDIERARWILQNIYAEHGVSESWLRM
jgi:hypothetical protein